MQWNIFSTVWEVLHLCIEQRKTPDNPIMSQITTIYSFLLFFIHHCNIIFRWSRRFALLVCWRWGTWGVPLVLCTVTVYPPKENKRPDKNAGTGHVRRRDFVLPESVSHVRPCARPQRRPSGAPALYSSSKLFINNSLLYNLKRQINKNRYTILLLQ